MTPSGAGGTGAVASQAMGSAPVAAAGVAFWPLSGAGRGSAAIEQRGWLCGSGRCAAAAAKPAKRREQLKARPAHLQPPSASAAAAPGTTGGAEATRGVAEVAAAPCEPALFRDSSIGVVVSFVSMRWFPGPLVAACSRLHRLHGLTEGTCRPARPVRWLVRHPNYPLECRPPPLPTPCSCPGEALPPQGTQCSLMPAANIVTRLRVQWIARAAMPQPQPLPPPPPLLQAPRRCRRCAPPHASAGHGGPAGEERHHAEQQPHGAAAQGEGRGGFQRGGGMCLEAQAHTCTLACHGWHGAAFGAAHLPVSRSWACAAGPPGAVRHLSSHGATTAPVRSGSAAIIRLVRTRASSCLMSQRPDVKMLHPFARWRVPLDSPLCRDGVRAQGAGDCDA